jgi:CBS domain containing-hemolysin-like protein
MFALMLPMFATAAEQPVIENWESSGSIVLRLLAILALVLLNGFFVAAEFALVRVRVSQLDPLVADGAKNAARTRRLVARLDEYLSATQLGITLASLGLGWLGEPFLAAMIEPLLFKLGITTPFVVHGISFVIAFSAITYLHIVVGELAPKSLAIRKALEISLLVSRPLRVFYILFRPAIWFLNGNANTLVRRVFRIEPVGESELVHSEEELRVILSESQKSDEVSALGKELLINALDLKHRIVRDIMTPRGDVVYLDVDEPFDAEIARIIESRHTRFPICREQLDGALGLVHIKDLLALVHSGTGDLMDIRREVLHVSEMMPLEKLLRFFLTRHGHLAIVVDEYGGAVGIVTLDNVIEELVGTIQDEFDTPDEDVIQINESEFELEGTHALYELEEKLGADFTDADVTTIGGYLTARLGHLPSKGECIRIEDWVATVTDSDDRRVLRVNLKRDPLPKPGGEDDETNSD